MQKIFLENSINLNCSDNHKRQRIFTGNYEDCKIGNLISISGNRGKSVGFKGKSLPQLAPKLNFWKTWHENIGKIPEEENTKYYIKQYYSQVLSQVDILDLLKDEKDPILLCYERGQEFCHRHVLAEYLNIRYGIDVKDIIIKIDDNKVIIQENSRPQNIRPLLLEVLREDLENIQDEAFKN